MRFSAALDSGDAANSPRNREPDHLINDSGLFKLATLSRNETLARPTLAIHRAGQRLLYALIVLHLLGAIWVVLRDDTLDRMLPLRAGASGNSAC
jgi:hypothetical protein